MKIYHNFQAAKIAVAKLLLTTGKHYKVGTWQSQDTKNTPKESMFEALDISFKCPIGHPDFLEVGIKPNMPWAKDHFQERIGRQPLNPGEQYKNWPFYRGKPENDTHRKENQRFSHTYMERIWPKFAKELPNHIMEGIRYEYGDLDSVINLLSKEPNTRQAYLPIWFPEDTGSESNQRVPCTLGYLFTQRNGFLHITYYMRSCDFLRHFSDDIYLAAKLADWVLGELQRRYSNWSQVELGLFTMHIANMHIFSTEVTILEKWIKDNEPNK